MYRILFILSFMAFQVMATTHIHTTPMQEMQFDPQSKYFADGVEDGHLKVVVEKVYFPAGSQKRKLQQAFALIEQVINSQEFKEKVIGYVAASSKERQYTGNNGLSNEQIYNRLMSGEELMMKDTTGEMNLFITKYNSWWSKVIAWTNPRSDKWIHVNWRFYKRFSVDQMASNIVHEWAHLMGFFHVSKNDSDSVPYAVGRIAGEVAKHLLNKKELDANSALVLNGVGLH